MVSAVLGAGFGASGSVQLPRALGSNVFLQTLHPESSSEDGPT